MAKQTPAGNRAGPVPLPEAGRPPEWGNPGQERIRPGQRIHLRPGTKIGGGTKSEEDTGC